MQVLGSSMCCHPVCFGRLRSLSGLGSYTYKQRWRVRNLHGSSSTWKYCVAGIHGRVHVRVPGTHVRVRAGTGIGTVADTVAAGTVAGTGGWGCGTGVADVGRMVVAVLVAAGGRVPGGLLVFGSLLGAVRPVVAG